MFSQCDLLNDNRTHCENIRNSYPIHNVSLSEPLLCGNLSDMKMMRIRRFLVETKPLSDTFSWRCEKLSGIVGTQPKPILNFYEFNTENIYSVMSVQRELASVVQSHRIYIFRIERSKHLVYMDYYSDSPCYLFYKLNNI